MILQASPASSFANTCSQSSSPYSWVMSGRRSTAPLSRSQRVRYHVAKMRRPETACTVRFLKIAAAMSTSTRRDGMPKKMIRAPFRAMRIAS